MGKVRENDIALSLKAAGLKTFNTHVLSRQLERLENLLSEKPNATHLQDSIEIKSLLLRQEKVNFIIVLADPVARNLLAFFQNSKDRLANLQNCSSVELRAALIKEINVNSPQEWIDKEVSEYLKVNWNTLKDYDGGTFLAASRYGNVLIIKRELPAADISAALSKFLNAKIVVENNPETLPGHVQKLYARVVADGLPSSYVIESLDHNYIKRVYSDIELNKFKETWKDTLKDDTGEALKPYSNCLLYTSDAADE